MRAQLPDAFRQTLVRAAAEAYRPAGRYARHFAQGKLAGDPIFPALLEQALIPDRARVLDLGCGQGLLAAWLRTARERWDAGDWPAGLPAPPSLRGYRGIDALRVDIQRAQMALGRRAAFECGDLLDLPWPAADVVVLFDVLHYLDAEAQPRLLERIRYELPADGRLLLRVGDRAAGLGQRRANLVDHTVAWLRGYGRRRFSCRTRQAWDVLLRQAGFTPEAQPMSSGTPFANVLFVARPCRD